MEAIPADTHIVPFSRTMAVIGLIIVAMGLWLGLAKGLFPLIELREETGQASILEGPPVFTTISGVIKAIGGDSENSAVKGLSAEGVMSVLHRLGLYTGILVTGFGILVLFRAGLRRKREKIEDTQQEAAFKTLIDGDRGVNAK